MDKRRWWPYCSNASGSGKGENMTMPDLTPYMPTLIMAAIAAAIIIAGIIVYKLIGGSVRGRRGSRLGISEYHELDKARRLVLVRRDDVEHLLLIGGAHDIVVESGIGSALSQPAALEQSATARPLPRPAVFAPRRPVLRPVEPTLEADPSDTR
jgi:Flagellar biosynthesis protein, FliO